MSEGNSNSEMMEKSSTDAVNEGDSVVHEDSPKISKKDAKRLKRKQLYDQLKAEKKQKIQEEKEKKSVDEGNIKPSSERNEAMYAERQERRKNQEQEFLQTASNNFHVIIDCSWENDHSESSLKSLDQQIMLSYGINKKHEKPVYLHLTHLGPKQSDHLQRMNVKSWRAVSTSTEDYITNPLFSIGKEEGKRQLVYLTSDGDETLESLSPSEAYIIGGIVDRNRLKGITYNKAKEQGIRTAKLPIKENIALAATHILTVNHVFDILMTFQMNQNWKETMEKVIPKRKEKGVITHDGEDEEVQEEEAKEEDQEVKDGN